MTGWVKIEKDLVSDPRFLRMVRAFRNADVTQPRISERTAVTRLLGGLTFIWIYADSHVREDDTLDLGTDEINELVGIENFAQFMPADWLEVVDPHRVKLPGFHEHNGTEAKRKALTRKRVERHRIRNSVTDPDDMKRTSVTGALPDQTRPDQTRPAHTQAAPVPDPLTEGFDDWALDTYPQTAQRQDWQTALHSARAIVGMARATEADLRRRLTGFRAFVDSGGLSDPSKVPSPQRWFALHQQGEPYWGKEWAAVTPRAKGQRTAAELVSFRPGEAASGGG